MGFTPTRAPGGVSTTPVTGWQVQSSVVAGDDGQAISRAYYRAAGWLVAPARSTVMAALLANGRYPDIFRSTTMRDCVDPADFQVPWWYRTVFTVSGGGRTLVRTEGVIHKGELWVNGVRVAAVEDLAGAYPVCEFDVTTLVEPGANALAVRVFPGHPMTDLSVGWIDWNPTPPDTNMGIWRDVTIVRTGDVRLADPHVRSQVSDSLDRADLKVAVDVENGADAERLVTVVGVVGGHGALRRFDRAVRLAGGERRRLYFDSTDMPALAIEQPQLWWPVGHGEQPLYDLQLTTSVDGLLCDQSTTSFGIRQVSSYIADGGGRQFVVNGRRVQVIGGGWCPDIFLRYDYQRLVDELTYTVDLGLNAIRLEGKLENQEFYDLADRLGLVVLPGWECCNKWEAHAGTGGAAWSEHDYLVARRSMAGEARLLRNHPCVVSFQIGSDFAPPPRTADIYVEELAAAEWDLPVVSSGASEFNNDPTNGYGEFGTTATAGAGPSGMKMWPYDWVPPVYWYGDSHGAAVGFDSECSAGHSIPRLASLRKMLSPVELEQLWQQPSAHQYHSAPRPPFDNIAIFTDALIARYGAANSLHDFLRKAQLANYEVVRAQFEAYRCRFDAAQPATGVIYWMLNNAWPSLNWHLYDYYLDPAAAYFGAKKANEPVHVQYAYDTGEVLVVNHRPRAVGPCAVELVVRDISGAVCSHRAEVVDTLESGAAVSLGSPEVPSGVSTTYFLELSLRLVDGGETPKRNVYWLSTTPDVLDWPNTFWQHTPQTGYADLTGLQRLPSATVEVTAESVAQQGQATTVVTLRNSSAIGTPAVGLHVSLTSGAAHDPVLPIRWDDNDVTLFAGQGATLTGRYSATGVSVPVVRVEGFNLTAPVVVV